MIDGQNLIFVYGEQKDKYVHMRTGKLDFITSANERLVST